jgi:DNA-binding LacI/PurR family transcriptional regulator
MNMREIAKEAGVSVATVSRVVNEHPMVSPENVSSVRAVIEALGYTPKGSRRGRPAKRLYAPGTRTGNVGLIMMGNSERMYENPFTSRLIGAISAAAQEHGVHLMLDSMDDATTLCASIKQGRLDGAMVLTSAAVTGENLTKLARCLPIVHLLAQDHSSLGVDHVTVDNQAVGELAYQYLANQGVASLAFLQLSAKLHPALLARARAFIDVAAKHGRKVRGFALASETYDPCDHLPASCFSSMDQASLLCDMPSEMPRPIGLFVGNDEQLVDTYDLLRAQGLEPGRDVIVISVDNIKSITERLNPAPVSIHIGVKVIAERAIERLLKRIESPDAAPQVSLAAPSLPGLLNVS